MITFASYPNCPVDMRSFLASCVMTSLLGGAMLVTAPQSIGQPVAAEETVLNTPGPPSVVKSGDFSLAIIPDTQYYLAQAQLGGTSICSRRRSSGSRKIR